MWDGLTQKAWFYPPLSSEAAWLQPCLEPWTQVRSWVHLFLPFPVRSIAGTAVPSLSTPSLQWVLLGAVTAGGPRTMFSPCMWRNIRDVGSPGLSHRVLYGGLKLDHHAAISFTAFLFCGMTYFSFKKVGLHLNCSVGIILNHQPKRACVCVCLPRYFTRRLLH